MKNVRTLGMVLLDYLRNNVGHGFSSKEIYKIIVGNNLYYFGNEAMTPELSVGSRLSVLYEDGKIKRIKNNNIFVYYV